LGLDKEDGEMAVRLLGQQRQGAKRLAIVIAGISEIFVILYLVHDVTNFRKLNILPAIGLIVAGPFSIWLIYLLGFWVADGFKKGRKQRRATHL